MTASARERSFWAWGYEDALPDAAERDRLGLLASAALGGATFEPRDAPAIEAISIPEPRVEIPAELADFATTARRARASHTYGKSYRDLVRGLSGDFSKAPDIVATPRNEEDVTRVLEWAQKQNVAVLPYGGGTSVVSGTEADIDPAFAGALSLDMSAMDRVLEIDDFSLCARIAAGAAGPVLESQLAERDLTLRFYPQSFELSTLGGWIATRAGGHFATVETHIDELVASTRAITGSGLWQTRRLPASGAGPAPDRLMIGSEGALGVITEAWVRVRKRPTHRAKATIAFDDWSAALDALRALAQSRLYPTNCRLLDAREALLHQVGGPPGKHLLILGFEAADREVDELHARGVAIAEGAGGVVVSSGSGGAADKWRTAFMRTPYLFSALVSLGLVVDTFETAISWDKMDDFHASIVSAARGVMKRESGVGLVTTRVTHVYPDGLAPYYTFITTAKPGEELAVWSKIKTAVSDAIGEGGGTITHHHAVGRVHEPWYRREVPELFGRVMASAKRELDPAGILNPGVLVP